MPNYDFKCNKCGKLEEGKFSFKEAEKGFACGSCNGKMELDLPKCHRCGDYIHSYKHHFISDKEDDFKLIEICTKCCNRLERRDIVPYQPGLNAREDRKRAFIAQEEQGKLPKDINEHNANFADLL